MRMCPNTTGDLSPFKLHSPAEDGPYFRLCPIKWNKHTHEEQTADPFGTQFDPNIINAYSSNVPHNKGHTDERIQI